MSAGPNPRRTSSWVPRRSAAGVPRREPRGRDVDPGPRQAATAPRRSSSQDATARWCDCVKPRSAAATGSPASCSARPSACAQAMQRSAYSAPGRAVRGGEPEPAQPAGVVVGGQPRVDGAEHALRDIGVAGDDRAAGRAAVGLVRRERHDRGALAQRVLEAAAGDQPRHVRGVVEDRGPVWPHRRSGQPVREQHQRAAEHDQRRPLAVEELRQRLEVDVVAARRTAARRRGGRGCRRRPARGG